MVIVCTRISLSTGFSPREASNSSTECHKINTNTLPVRPYPIQPTSTIEQNGSHYKRQCTACTSPPELKIKREGTSVRCKSHLDLSHPKFPEIVRSCIGLEQCDWCSDRACKLLRCANQAPFE